MSSFGKYNTSEILLNSFFGKVGNAFGLIPMFPASTGRKKCIFRAYTFCFYFLAIGFIVYSYYLMQLEIRTNSLMSYLVFVAFWPILHLLLLVTGVYGAIRNEPHWRKMFENISRFDEILRRKVLFERSEVSAHIISSVIGYCTIIIQQIFESIETAHIFSNKQLCVIYTIELIVQSQMLWMTTIINELCSGIKRRYDYLTDSLTTTFNVRRREVDGEIDLYEIKQMYIILHNTVEHFNAIFGMFAIYLLTNSLLTLLDICVTMIGDQLVRETNTWTFPVYLIIQNSQMFWMTTIIYELCNCIKRRYDYLTGLLSATFNVRRREVDVEIDLYEIKQMCVILHDTVEHIIAIFGMFAIYLLTNSLLTLLEECVTMIGDQLTRKGMHTWIFSVYIIIQNVYTLIIILSCDRVEKSAKKLLVTSYRLQVKDGVDNITKECIDLSKVIKNLSPEFTTLGLFRINQRLIPAFLSSMASYVIVLLQFNFKLDHDNSEV
ncbi:hypothetical protein JTB14_029260 [Gonioctena quinquepunctata]|nr:hypothetical protein JTB14_029260 [Gonioctena quinquepunctata]